MTMRSSAEIERARRHFREVFRRARSQGDELEALMCGVIHDALGWAAGGDEPLDPHVPAFRDLLRQLDAAEGNTPN